MHEFNILLSQLELSSFIITLVSIIVTLISILFAIIEIYKRKKAEKTLKSITWEDMRNASEHIAKKLNRKYQPAVIYIPNIKSGIMLQFIKNHFKEYIPVIVGHTMPKHLYSEKDFKKIKGLDSYWRKDTQKWYAFIPKILLEYKDQNILILDNLSLTGNFLEHIKNELISQGIPREHIATACIATTEAAIADRVAPQYYYKKLTDSQNVYMPWGK